MEHDVDKRFGNYVNNVCDEEMINSIICIVEYEVLRGWLAFRHNALML